MASMPPMFTPEAPDAIAPRSSRTTLRPRWARCQAADAPAMPPPLTTMSVSIEPATMRRILPRGDRSVHVPQLPVAHDRDRLAHPGRRVRADVLVLGIPRAVARGV